MPKLGKDTFLVQLISHKTKIKPADILDVLKALSECLAEAFFEESPAEKQRVSFGFVTAYWRNTKFGPGIFFKPSEAFKKQAVEIKFKQNNQFAVLLYQKMMKKHKERIAERLKVTGYNNNKRKYKKRVYSEEYTENQRQNTQILREKRKKQKEMLRNSI